MNLKRAILAKLGRDELKQIVEGLELEGVDRRSVDEMRQAQSRARRATPAMLLDLLGEAAVKAVCEAVGVSPVGRRALLIERLLAPEPKAEVPALPLQPPERKTEVIPLQAQPPERKQGNEFRSTGGKRAIEQYEHGDKMRANNPPVGLVTPHTDPDAGKKRYAYDPHLDPTLVWAGKAEQGAIEVPTVSLHVHERIDPRTIIKAVRKRNGERNKAGGAPTLTRSASEEAPIQRSLFEEPAENPPLREAVDFYRHAHGWSNRLIAGNSLLVMNSLLEKEAMAGKVQMVYIDPPYGIKYGSNFQPFINRRDVKDGKDDDLTQEPEMVQAFRDTWELGIHSYLTYLRDRLLLARELLHDSGSCFVQISDDNVHRVRCVMDDIFGVKNAMPQIVFRKTTGAGSPSGYVEAVPQTFDYLVWYAKDRAIAKIRRLFVQRGVLEDENLRWVELADGTRRRMTKEEALNPANLPKAARPFRPNPLTSQSGGETTIFEYECEGRGYRPSKGGWKTNREGMDRLKAARRLMGVGNTLCYVRYLDDFPYRPVIDIWDDTRSSGFGEQKVYVVQTNPRVIERCTLMTTDPGDLVFDPTCGSGTTASVAEQWGRRWITCDTSRVSIALAKQRLLTTPFAYYQLAHPEQGVSSGFNYRRIPHVTLKSIANNDPPSDETLYDEAELEKSKIRVTGPFTVEAVPAPAVRPISEVVIEDKPAALDEQPTLAGIGPLDGQTRLELREEVAVARYGETARQREWRDELLKCGIRGKSGQRIEFARIEPLGGNRWLQCEAETKAERPQRVVVSFGPEFAPLEQRQVESALEEAVRLKPQPELVVFAAFQFDPEAAKDIDETRWPGVTLLKVQMNTDLLTDDLKKKRASNESYWLVGQPDVAVERLTGERSGLWRVEVHGFDYYNPRTGQIESGDTSKIAMWMLDTDYDGRSLFPRQVFFPMAGEKDGWARLARNLKAEIDEELIEAYRGAVSLPFEAGEHQRVAVKIVDDRGIESLKIVELNG